LSSFNTVTTYEAVNTVTTYEAVNSENTVVLKFGGAAVATPESFAHIAHIVKLRKNAYTNVVVAISAMGNTTDELIDLAKRVHPTPPKREMDMLLSVGERISMSLLAMALHHSNVAATSLTGSQSGIITTNTHSEARIVDVKPRRVLEGLTQGEVVIVAGFQGMSLAGEITTLGRGGTDSTAVALAVALNCNRVEFYKDVAGVYTKDPNHHEDATLLQRLTFAEMLALAKQGAQVLHDRSVKLAEKNGVFLHVMPFSGFDSSALQPQLGTLIGDGKGLGSGSKGTLIGEQIKPWSKSYEDQS
jgi:aspartate kinase